MTTLILFWSGGCHTELKLLAERAGFQFESVLIIGSHWMTPPAHLHCVEVGDFAPEPSCRYIILVNKAEHNQTVPVIAKLTAVSAEFEVYDFYYGDMVRLWPL
ncbi:MAG: hypothetical protein ACOZBH_01105 [Patescibacteria group bacterium]